MKFTIMLAILFALASAGIGSYFAITGNQRADLSGYARSATDYFAGFFSLFPRTKENETKLVQLVKPAGVTATRLELDGYLPIGVSVVDHSWDIPDYKKFLTWNEDVVDVTYRYDLNSEEAVQTGARLVKRSEIGDRLISQKTLWAWRAPQGTAALVVGAFENQDLDVFKELSRFKHVILTDLWDKGDNMWSSEELFVSSRRFITDESTVVKGDQSVTVPLVLAKLAAGSVGLGLASIEGASSPYLHISTALLAFKDLVVGGVMIINSAPHQAPSEISLYGGSNNELTIGAATILAILRGRFTMLEQSLDNPSYFAIQKVATYTTNDWNAGSIWHSPFGLTLDTLQPYLGTSALHKLKNIHHLNVLGFGTRWEECENCGKKLEIGHVADWEQQVQFKMGPCEIAMGPVGVV